MWRVRMVRLPPAKQKRTQRARRLSHVELRKRNRRDRKTAPGGLLTKRGLLDKPSAEEQLNLARSSKTPSARQSQRTDGVHDGVVNPPSGSSQAAFYASTCPARPPSSATSSTRLNLRTHMETT